MQIARIALATAVAGVALGGALAAQEKVAVKPATPAATIAPAAPAAAQDPAEQQAKFKELYAQKLKKEFIANGGWLTDYDQARKLAKEQGKLLFTYFSRSYSP